MPLLQWLLCFLPSAVLWHICATLCYAMRCRIGCAPDTVYAGMLDAVKQLQFSTPSV